LCSNVSCTFKGVIAEVNSAVLEWLELADAGFYLGPLQADIVPAALDPQIILLARPRAHRTGHFEKTGVASTAWSFGYDSVAHFPRK